MELDEIIEHESTILVLGILLGVIAGGWLTVFYFGLLDDLLSSISNLSSVISAFATVVLVLVTAAYVILTWRLVRETREAREQEVMPVMNLELESYMVGARSPVIRNIGNGPAMDVEAELWLEPDGEKYDIRSKNIAPGEFTLSLYPSIGKETREKYSKLVVDGCYTDVFDEKDCFRDEIDLADLAMLDEIRPDAHQDQQIKELRKIEKSLSTIAEELDRFGLRTKLDSREKIIELLKEHESLTVKELSEETGVNPAEMGALLTFLEGAGAVEYESKRDNNFPDQDVEIRLKSSK